MSDLDLNQMLNTYKKENETPRLTYIRSGKYIAEIESFTTTPDKNNKPCFLVGFRICALHSKASSHDVGDVVFWKRSINKFNIKSLDEITKALNIDTDTTDLNNLFDDEKTGEKGIGYGKKLIVELFRPEGKQFDETKFLEYDLSSQSFSKNLDLAKKLADIKKKQVKKEFSIGDEEVVPF